MSVFRLVVKSLAIEASESIVCSRGKQRCRASASENVGESRVHLSRPASTVTARPHSEDIFPRAPQIGGLKPLRPTITVPARWPVPAASGSASTSTCAPGTTRAGVPGTKAPKTVDLSIWISLLLLP